MLRSLIQSLRIGIFFCEMSSGGGIEEAAPKTQEQQPLFDQLWKDISEAAESGRSVMSVILAFTADKK
jgi:hypothetical protein